MKFESDEAAAGTRASGVLFQRDVDGRPMDIPSVDLGLCKFLRLDSDLIITTDSGQKIVLVGYFFGETGPDLIGSGGYRLPFDYVLKLSESPISGQYAQLGGALTQPIGRIETILGIVEITRADGARVVVSKSDLVYAGDVVQTNESAAVSIILADETVLSLAERGRVVLDEMAYDPAQQTGKIGMSLATGILSFVSGKIAKIDPDAMAISTPIATVGIRGTTGSINLGASLTVVLIRDPNGTTGEIAITTAKGVEVLTNNLAAASIANDGAIRAFTMTASQLQATFGASLGNLNAVLSSLGSPLPDAVKQGPTDKAFGPDGKTEASFIPVQLQEQLLEAKQVGDQLKQLIGSIEQFQQLFSFQPPTVNSNVLETNSVLAAEVTALTIDYSTQGSMVVGMVSRLATVSSSGAAAEVAAANALISIGTEFKARAQRSSVGLTDEADRTAVNEVITGPLSAFGTTSAVSATAYGILTTTALVLSTFGKTSLAPEVSAHLAAASAAIEIAATRSVLLSQATVEAASVVSIAALQSTSADILVTSALRREAVLGTLFGGATPKYQQEIETALFRLNMSSPTQVSLSDLTSLLDNVIIELQAAWSLVNGNTKLAEMARALEITIEIAGHAKHAAEYAYYTAIARSAAQAKFFAENALDATSAARDTVAELQDAIHIHSILASLHSSLVDEALTALSQLDDSNVAVSQAMAAIESASKTNADIPALENKIRSLSSIVEERTAKLEQERSEAISAARALADARADLASKIITEATTLALNTAYQDAYLDALSKTGLSLNLIFSPSVSLGPLDREQSISQLQEFYDSQSGILEGEAKAKRSAADAIPDNAQLDTIADIAEQQLANSKAALKFVEALIDLLVTPAKDAAERASHDYDSALEAANAQRKVVADLLIASQLEFTQAIESAEALANARVSLATGGLELYIAETAKRVEAEIALDIAIEDAKDAYEKARIAFVNGNSLEADAYAAAAREAADGAWTMASSPYAPTNAAMLCDLALSFADAAANYSVVTSILDTRGSRISGSSVDATAAADAAAAAAALSRNHADAALAYSVDAERYRVLAFEAERDGNQAAARAAANAALILVERARIESLAAQGASARSQDFASEAGRALQSFDPAAVAAASRAFDAAARAVLSQTNADSAYRVTERVAAEAKASADLQDAKTEAASLALQAAADAFSAARSAAETAQDEADRVALEKSNSDAAAINRAHEFYLEAKFYAEQASRHAKDADKAAGDVDLAAAADSASSALVAADKAGAAVQAAFDVALGAGAAALVETQAAVTQANLARLSAGNAAASLAAAQDSLRASDDWRDGSASASRAESMLIAGQADTASANAATSASTAAQTATNTASAAVAPRVAFAATSAAVSSQERSLSLVVARRASADDGDDSTTSAIEAVWDSAIIQARGALSNAIAAQTAARAASETADAAAGLARRAEAAALEAAAVSAANAATAAQQAGFAQTFENSAQGAAQARADGALASIESAIVSAAAAVAEYANAAATSALNAALAAEQQDVVAASSAALAANMAAAAAQTSIISAVNSIIAKAAALGLGVYEDIVSFGDAKITLDRLAAAAEALDDLASNVAAEPTPALLIAQENAESAQAAKLAFLSASISSAMQMVRFADASALSADAEAIAASGIEADKLIAAERTLEALQESVKAFDERALSALQEVNSVLSAAQTHLSNVQATIAARDTAQFAVQSANLAAAHASEDLANARSAQLVALTALNSARKALDSGEGGSRIDPEAYAVLTNIYNSALSAYTKAIAATEKAEDTNRSAEVAETKAEQQAALVAIEASKVDLSSAYNAIASAGTFSATAQRFSELAHSYAISVGSLVADPTPTSDEVRALVALAKLFVSEASMAASEAEATAQAAIANFDGMLSGASSRVVAQSAAANAELAAVTASEAYRMLTLLSEIALDEADKTQYQVIAAEAALSVVLKSIRADAIASASSSAAATADINANDDIDPATDNFADAAEKLIDAKFYAALAKAKAESAVMEFNGSNVSTVIDLLANDARAAATSAASAATAAQSAATEAKNALIEAAETLGLTLTSQSATAAAIAMTLVANEIINDLSATTVAKALAEEALQWIKDALNSAEAAQNDAAAALQAAREADVQANLAENVENSGVLLADAYRATIQSADQRAETSALSAEASKTIALLAADNANDQAGLAVIATRDSLVKVIKYLEAHPSHPDSNAVAAITEARNLATEAVATIQIVSGSDAGIAVATAINGVINALNLAIAQTHQFVTFTFSGAVIGQTFTIHVPGHGTITINNVTTLADLRDAFVAALNDASGPAAAVLSAQAGLSPGEVRIYVDNPTEAELSVTATASNGTTPTRSVSSIESALLSFKSSLTVAAQVANTVGIAAANAFDAEENARALAKAIDLTLYASITPTASDVTAAEAYADGVSQRSTVTLAGSVGIGDAFRLTINGRSYTYIASDGVNIAQVRDELVTLASANMAVTVSAGASSGEIVVAAKIPGVAFTLTTTVTDADSVNTMTTINDVANAKGSDDYANDASASAALARAQETLAQQAANQAVSGASQFSQSLEKSSQEAALLAALEAANALPEAIDDTTSVNEDQFVSLNLLANDRRADGALLKDGSITSVGMPAHGRVMVTPQVDTITLSGTPGAGDTYSVTVNGRTVTYTAPSGLPDVRASIVNAINSDFDLMPLVKAEVGAGSDVITLTAVTPGQPFFSSVAKTDAGSANDHGIAVCTTTVNGLVTYKPSANFNGTDSFTYTVANNAVPPSFDVATVYITIFSVNDVPVLSADFGTVVSTAGVTVAVLANDREIDGDRLSISSLTYRDVSHASTVTNNGVAVTLNSNGTVTYVPSASSLLALAQGQTALDTFSYTVSDGYGGTATQAVTITLIGSNDVPIASGVNIGGGTVTTIEVNEDTPLSGSFVAIDPDTEAVLSYSIVPGGAPMHGTLQTVGRNFVYTPALDYVGADSFIYRVVDEFGIATTKAITINVVNVNDTPVAVDDVGSAIEDGGFVLFNVLANDMDLDAADSKFIDSSTPAFSTKGAAITFGTGANATLSYNPNGVAQFDALAAGQSTTDTITYVMRDAAGLTSTATLTVTVAGVNDAPIAFATSFSIDEDTTYNGVFTARDPDSGALLTYSVVPNLSPAHGTVTFNSQVDTVTIGSTLAIQSNDQIVVKINGLSAIYIHTGINTPAGVASGLAAFIASNVTFASLVTASASANSGTLTLTSKIVGQQFIAAFASSDLTLTSTSTVPNGSYIYTPTADYDGTDIFSYRVVDQFGQSSEANVIVTIFPETGPTIGGPDDDILFGGSGNDLLLGGAGADTLSGRQGADRFVYTSNVDSNRNALDSITDFASGVDKIEFTGMSGISYFGTDRLANDENIGSTVLETVAIITADHRVNNEIVFFAQDGDGYLYVKGEGAYGSVSFDGSLIKLAGITSAPAVADFVGFMQPDVSLVESWNFDRQSFIRANIDEPETNISREIVFRTEAGGGLFDVNYAGHDRHLVITSDGNVYSRVWSEEVLRSSGLNLLDGQIHKLFFTLGAGGTNIYVDGVLVAHGNKTSSDFNWGPWIDIGYSADAGTFDGQIASYRSWNVELTADQISGALDVPAAAHQFIFDSDALTNLMDTGTDAQETGSISIYGSPRLVQIAVINGLVELRPDANDSIMGSIFDDVISLSGAGQRGDFVQLGDGRDKLILDNNFSNTVDVANIETVVGGDGNDSIGTNLSGPNLLSGSELAGGAGWDTLRLRADGAVSRSAEELAGISGFETWLSESDQTYALTLSDNNVGGGESLAIRAYVDEGAPSGTIAHDFVLDASAETNGKIIAYGSSGNDNLIGGFLGDELFGGDGNDVLRGGSGNDRLYGDSGDDTLDGGVGADNLVGGQGSDVFVFHSRDSNLANPDIIADFEGGTDKIYLQGVSGLSYFGVSSPASIYNGTLGATVSETVGLILADASRPANSIVFFAQGGDGYLYVNGSGANGSEDFDSTLIRLAGVTTPPAVEDLAGYRQVLGGPVSLTQSLNDQIMGNSGDNLVTLVGAAENGDFINLGGGTDTVRLDGRFANVVNFANVENVIGGAGNDMIGTNLSRSNLLSGSQFVGGAGWDTLRLRADGTVSRSAADLAGVSGFEAWLLGSDQSYALTLNDNNVSAGQTLTIRAAAYRSGEITRDLLLDASAETDGTVVFYGSAGNDTLIGGAGDDTLVGGVGHNNLRGGDGNDLLIAGGTYDILSGGQGNDSFLIHSGWAEILDFGIGSDDVEISSSGLVTLDLFSDWYASSNSSNDGTAYVSANGFNVDVSAAGGYSGWNISNSPGLTAVSLRGSAGADTIIGGDGNDLLSGGLGSDRILGGLGFDIASFSGRLADYMFSATSDGELVVSGPDGLDKIADVELLRFDDATLQISKDENSNFVLTGSNSDDVIRIDSYATRISGLQANYYIGDNGNGDGGQLYVSRIDPNIDFQNNSWGSGLPYSNTERFHVDWSGQITAPVSGLVTFYASHDDGARLVIDGITVFENWRDQGAGYYNSTGSIWLERGKTYDFYAQMYENGGGDSFRLYWSYDGLGGIQIVEPTYFTIANQSSSAFTLIGANGDDILTGDLGNDVLDGGVGNDTLLGGAGDDIYYASSGHDKIYAGSGSDKIIFRPGFEVLGAELIDYDLDGNLDDLRFYYRDGSSNLFDLTIVDHLSQPVASFEIFEFDKNQVFSISMQADQSWSNIDLLAAGSNLNDSLATGSGNDVLLGNDGDDVLFGGPGNDEIFGGAGNDVLLGGLGDDRLRGGSGDDVIDGGEGEDTVSFEFTAHSIVVDLSDSDWQNTGDGSDQILHIENAEGSDFSDRITGTAETNFLWGNGGNDVITGLGGSDFLVGGAGSDRYVYTSTEDSTLNNPDWILDFQGGPNRDTIDVSAITQGGAIAYIGSEEFSTVNGQQAYARFDESQRLLEFDFDSDAIIDMSIGLSNIASATELTSDNLVTHVVSG